MFLRFFHIIQLQKSSFILDRILEIFIHYSTIVRKKVNVSIRLDYLILFAVHCCVVLWLFVGTRQKKGDSEIPWIEASP
jgi:hypothetical protein